MLFKEMLESNVRKMALLGDECEFFWIGIASSEESSSSNLPHFEIFENRNFVLCE